MSTFLIVGIAALSLHSLESLFAHYGYWIMALLIAGESAGLPLPGETSLLAGAYVAERGHLSIALVIATAAVAAIVGDNVGYLVGRHAGRGILRKYGRLFRMRERQLRMLDYYFAQHGAKTVFLGRWVALLRVGAALFAGASRMPWPKFFLWNALGGAAWAFTMGMVGYFFAGSIARIDKAFGVFGIAALVAATVLVFVFVRRAQRRLEARVEAQDREERGADDSGADDTATSREEPSCERGSGGVRARKQNDYPPAA